MHHWSVSVFSCCLLLIAIADAYPSKYQQPPAAAEPYDFTADDITEASDPVQVLLYRAVMQEMMDELDEKKPSNSIEEEEEAKEIADSNSDEVLQELQALQSIIEEKQDGRWLDQIEDVADLLPPNYHNSTEFRTKVGDLDVDETETVDKTTDGDTESAWMSDVVELSPDNDVRGPDFHCSMLNPCATGKYCFDTVEMSECRQCHVTGMDCIGDAQCCMTEDGSEALCVRGKCTADVPRGSPGTLCQTSEDCGDGLCCSQDPSLRQRVCKPLAKLNERCSPVIYLAEDIVLVDDNEFFCPCQGDLSCDDKQEVVYAPKPMRIDAGRHCRKLNAKAAAIAPKSDSAAPPPEQNHPTLFDTLRQARLESEDDQRFDEVLPLVHKNSKKAMEEPDDGPMM